MNGRLALAIGGIAAALLGALVSIALAQTPPDGAALFKARCASCHEPARERAPNRQLMAAMPRVVIVQALTTGSMTPMAAGLSRADIEAIAAHLAPPPFVPQPGSGPAGAAGRGGRGGAGLPPYAQTMEDVMCATHPPIRKSGSDWHDFLLEPTGQRFQKTPGLKAADVPKLKVKWAFSVNSGSYGQPVVVGDWLFLGTRAGLYALDAKTGCVHWRVEGLASRATPIVATSDLSPSGFVIYSAQRDRTVRAADAQTGKEIWKSAVIETHNAAGVTGSPMFYGNQIFVPITSGEEATAGSPTYRCCSFRGSLAALDARTGAIQWKTYPIEQAPKDTQPNSAGVMMQGPAGAAIWSAPVIDAKRGLIYVATGDSYTDVFTDGADAIVAMDMKTGAIRWKNQVLPNDNYIMGCQGMKKPPNCPMNDGPDYDYGAAPILFDLPNGKQIIVSGNKSGIAYGMDADTGKTLWATRLASGSQEGGIMWGIAADEARVYMPAADTMVIKDTYLRPQGKQIWGVSNPPPPRPGVSALDPATGRVLWHRATPKAPCKFYGDRTGRDNVPGVCLNASSAAVSVIPGVVFSGSLDGWLRAYDARTGRTIWAHSTTAQTYDTTNRVKGQPGGSIDGPGPTIAGGMVYTWSGYNGASDTGGNGVNVLLAYSVDGK